MRKRQSYDKVRRINLELGPNSQRALDALQQTLEASSQAETIRLALQTTARMISETASGGRVLVERPNGERVEIVFPLAPPGTLGSQTRDIKRRDRVSRQLHKEVGHASQK